MGKGQGNRQDGAAMELGVDERHLRLQGAIDQILATATREGSRLPPDQLPAGWGITGLRRETFDSGVAASAPAQRVAFEVFGDHLLETFPEDTVVVRGDNGLDTHYEAIAVRPVYPAGHPCAGEPTEALEMVAEWGGGCVSGRWRAPVVQGPLREEYHRRVQDELATRLRRLVERRVVRQVENLRDDLPEGWANRLVERMTEGRLDGYRYQVGARLSAEGVEPLWRHTADLYWYERVSFPPEQWNPRNHFDAATLTSACAHPGYLREAGPVEPLPDATH